MPRRPSTSSVHRAKPGARPNARPNARSGAKRGPSQRQLRVGELLRHALSEILGRGEVNDPELDGVSVTVTQVVPSADMRHATVFCEPLGGKNAKPVIAALNRHKGFLRGVMGRMIALRFTPELRFVEDTSFAEAERIEGLLKSARVQADLATDAARVDTGEIDGGDGA
jgi:ribosome-binding factor A